MSLHPGSKQHHLPPATSCTPFQKGSLLLPLPLPLRLSLSLLPLPSPSAMPQHPAFFWFPETLTFWKNEISWHPQATSCFPFLFLTYALSFHSYSPLLTPLLFFSDFSIDPFFSSPSSLHLFASLCSPCPIPLKLSGSM